MTDIGHDIELTIPLVAESSGPCVRWED
jgi:hypothetical protein